MLKKKWLLVAVGATGLGLMAVVLVLLWLVVSFFAGHVTAAVENSLPFSQTQQTASAHPGYRRTTLTSGSETYVNDFEEYGLQLINPEPTQVIGRRGFGKIFAIPGQPATAYVAVDVGSEMPAYEVFRNSKQPAFDWSSAKFREMQITRPNGTVLRSSDPEMLAALVS